MDPLKVLHMNSKMNITIQAISSWPKKANAADYLWPYLNELQSKEYHFEQKISIGEYIVDFICIHKKLIIALDDGQHVMNKEYDEKRTTYLNTLGYKVLHFWNDEIFMKTNCVIESIILSLEEYS